MALHLRTRRQTGGGYLSGPALNPAFLNRPRVERQGAGAEVGSVVIWSFIFLALGAWTLISWTLPFDIDSHPEKPLNYAILGKLGKLSELRVFGPQIAPEGDVRFLTGPELLQDLDGREREGEIPNANGLFMRGFLFNYPPTTEAPCFQGVMIPESVRPLGPDDLCTPGILVRGRSREEPKLELECLFPTPQAAEVSAAFPAEIPFQKTASYAAVLQARRTPGGDGWRVTLIPLAYPGVPLADGSRLAGRPPARLNMQAVRQETTRPASAP